MAGINRDILGTGWSFSLQIDSRGGIALSQGDGAIIESIRAILGTARGERRMRPNFGCDIHTLVFAPNNSNTWGLALTMLKKLWVCGSRASRLWKLIPQVGP
jgi:hypothetical protein